MDAAIAAPVPKVVPDDLPQHLRALERANTVRLARARLKRGVAHGEIDAAAIVGSCPPEVATMTVADLLGSQRRWGRTRTRKFLTPLRIAETRQLGALTERQRRLLALELAKRRAGGVPTERHAARGSNV
ncbi:MAG: hypothetical protein JSS68_09305 [Actinobacteria bacterium]|nr:hypothetical protein [Actinomycetota bacterium]MBS1882936.1 hypothetical protein [Actinomycetota bacterium]